MKYTKLIKSSLNEEKINFLKEMFKDDLFNSYDDASDITNAMISELEYKYEDEENHLDSNDFKKITGLSPEEYNKKINENKSQEIINDFESAKSNDIYTLKSALEELETSWAWNKLSSLIASFENLKHDGSSDLGYRKEHINDGQHKKIM